MKNVLKGSVLAVLLVLALVGVFSLLGCHGDTHDSIPLPVPSIVLKTSIECRPCDRRGPAITVDFPISSCDETDLRLCWIRDDRCWYGCETTGEIGGKGCNR